MVFRLNKNKKPMDICTEAKARYLLSNGYAVVHKRYPFTIRMKEKIVLTQPKIYTLKIDPGSKQTGLAIIDDDGAVVFLAVVEHRAEIIKGKIKTRHDARRNRRQRETKYRRCKFINHYLKKDSKYKAESPRPKGWLPPSVESITRNIDTWVNRLTRICPINHIQIEEVKFDTQKVANPTISGVAYQQGTLLGYEVREYLLEKYQHTCQYCKGESKDSKLEVEHKTSKANSGSGKVSNLTIAYRSCNKEKDSLNLEDWLEVLKNKKQKTQLTEKRIECIQKVLSNQLVTKNPKEANTYSAWVNSYRTRMVANAKKVMDNVVCSNGAETKMNRIQRNLPKEHYYDAACVGETPTTLKFKTNNVLFIKAYGRGCRFRGATNSCGIITRHFTRQKEFFRLSDRRYGQSCCQKREEYRHICWASCSA